MIKRIVIGFAVLFVLVVGAVLVFPGLLPLDTYKAEIARQVQRATGREFAINGDVRLSLIPRFELEARDVTFANAPGASEPHMARLDELELRMKLLPLLFGRLEVDRFVLVRPVINLEVDDAGKPNWDLPIAVAGREDKEADQPDTTFELDILKLADIRLQDGTITLHNRRTNRGGEVKGVNILVQVPEDKSAPADKAEEPAKQETEPAADTPAPPEIDPLLDFPILPSGLRLRDAMLEVGIASISGHRVDVRDFSFRGEVKEGRVAESPLSVTVGGTAFSGVVALDLRQQTPIGEFRLSTEKADVGELLDWLGILENAESSIEKSTLKITTQGSTLRQMAHVSGIAVSFEGGRFKIPDPETGGTLDITGVNLTMDSPGTGSGSLFDAKTRQSAAEPAASVREASLMDMRLLPSKTHLRDTRLDFRIARAEAEGVDIRDFSFRGEIKDGRVADSPLAVTVGETAFTGTVALDLRGDEPKGEFRLESGKVNIGKVLDRLEIAKGLDSAVEKSTLRLATTGATPRQMIDGLEIVAALEGGHISLTGPQSGGQVRVAVETMTAEEKPDRPFTLAVNGSIAKIPVEIRTETDRLIGFVNRPDKLSFKTDIKAVGVDLAFRGTTALPVERGQVELTTSLKGKSLASLSPLVDIDLPPLGPYSLDAKVTTTKTQYTLSNLDIRFGKSDLGGTGTLNFKSGKPRIDIKLETKTLQINDFIPKDEKSGKVKADAGEGTKPAEKSRAQRVAAAQETAGDTAAEAAKKWRALDAPEFMQSFDAALALKVDQVLSGADKLGNGALEAKLENGRFDVSKLHVAVPGGAVDTKFGFKPEGKGVSTDLAIQSKGFDYGILARRIDPKAKPEGVLDLNIALESKGPSLEDLMVNANGRFDFAVYPRNMEADIFDLWAANLVLVLLSTAEKDADSRSTLNCLVGRFTMKDGIMKEEALLMDTTTLVVAGEAEANFKTRRIAARVTPAAKRPAMFSAPAPISVDGAFDDFKVGVNFGDLLGTAIQFTTSVVTVPLLRLFGGRPPEDGSEACRKLMAGEAAAGEEKRAE